MNTTQLIMKGLRSPEKVPGYLYRNIQSVSQKIRLEAYRRRHSIDRQKPFIHEFIDNDEFVLVILDACRYDVFSEVYQEYLTGELKEVWASGRWTAQYCRRTWTEEYDLLYISDGTQKIEIIQVSPPGFKKLTLDLAELGIAQEEDSGAWEIELEEKNTSDR